MRAEKYAGILATVRALFTGRRRRANYILAVLWCSTCAVDLTGRWLEGVEWSTFGLLVMTIVNAWIWGLTTIQRLSDVGLSAWWWAPLYFSLILPLPAWMFMTYKSEPLAIYCVVMLQLPLMVCESDRFKPGSGEGKPAGRERP
jgi:uncharacterized membrane protein YhaH (DUF805 family)